MSRRILLVAILCLAAYGARADEQPIEFKADLDGGHEVPSMDSSGKGKLNAALNKSTKELRYTVTYQDLSGPATAAHFHGPAEPGKNAGIALPINGSLQSPIKGTATLDDKQMNDLLSNRWYVNVHTARNPDGEIRGQVTQGY